MRYGRTLLTGLGWAGTLGGLALSVLIFLSAYLAFDDHASGVKPREDRVIRLPSVPEAEVPRVPLARPSRRGAARRETTSDAVGAMGTGVGQVSPPVGHVIEGTGDTLGDAIDTLTPAPRRP